MTNLGFIGAGNMGKPMILRLLAAGYSVTVYNRSVDKITDLPQRGAVLAATPAEVTRQAEVIFLCLTNDAAVEQVVFGPRGIIHADAPGMGKIIVDTSSLSPSATVDFATRLKSAVGYSWIDAPVSGGVIGAQNGSLIFICGGDKTELAYLEPVFLSMGRQVTHMGSLGSGQITKLCNQIIVSCNLAVIAETMHFAKQAGVDAAQLPTALSGGWADSLPLQIYGPRMATVAERPRIGEVRLMAKDIANAQQFAAATGTHLPMCSAAQTVYQRIVEMGYANADLEQLLRQFDRESQ